MGISDEAKGIELEKAIAWGGTCSAWGCGASHHGASMEQIGMSCGCYAVWFSGYCEYYDQSDRGLLHMFISRAKKIFVMKYTTLHQSPTGIVLCSAHLSSMLFCFHSNKFKLIILDECDAMTKDAQFALRRGEILFNNCLLCQ